jgi:heme-degrading monooxygenase HmoA
MYVAFYRWRLNQGQEAEFSRLWHEGTLLFRTEQGALGSRLHKAEDGTYFAYAQWPSREAYHAKKHLSPEHRELLQAMQACVGETFPTHLGAVEDDLLIRA